MERVHAGRRHVYRNDLTLVAPMGPGEQPLRGYPSRQVPTNHKYALSTYRARCFAVRALPSAAAHVAEEPASHLQIEG